MMLNADHPTSNWHDATNGKGPTPLQRCITCNGVHNPYCRDHGIAAANARQSEFMRRWNERHGD